MARRPITGVGGTLVLDSDGLSKLAAGDPRVRAHVEVARQRGARVVVSAVTLTEVLRGRQRDALVYRVLSRLLSVPVTADLARRAGELLGATRLPADRCTVDAVVAVTALTSARPVLLLTSDPDDLSQLVEEPDVPKDNRVAVVRV